MHPWNSIEFEEKNDIRNQLPPLDEKIKIELAPNLVEQLTKEVRIKVAAHLND